MAVVANQAVAFDKSMLMACPHLGDVLRPGLILDHEQAGSRTCTLCSTPCMHKVKTGAIITS